MALVNKKNENGQNMSGTAEKYQGGPAYNGLLGVI